MSVMGLGEKVRAGVDLLSFSKKFMSDKNFADQFVGITDPEKFLEAVRANGYSFTMDDLKFVTQMGEQEIVSLLNYNTLVDRLLVAIDEDGMSIETVQEGDKITFKLSGRLGGKTYKQLEKLLLPAFDEAEEVVLDMGNLIYLSSAGLRIVLMGQKTSNLKNIPMSIQNVPDEIMEIFKMTGFADILNIV